MPDETMLEEVRYEQGFAAVPNELLKDERVTCYHIAIFAVIAMHANTNLRAWPSMNRIAKMIGASRSKVKSAINELATWGWLRKRQRWNEGTRRYDANIYELSRSLQGRACGDRGVGHVVTGGRAPRDQELEPENKNQLNHSTADAVIDYLNVKAERSYRHTATNRKLVGARLNDGFTQHDCERVIDTKVADWKGDAKMDQYLRPSTLFAPSKFESYLNQKASSRAEDALDIVRRIEAEADE